MMRAKEFAHLFIYICFLGIVLPLVVGALASKYSDYSLHTPVTMILGLTVVLYSVCRLAVLSWSCPRGMLKIVFFIFIYIWAGLAPMYQLAVGAMPWRVVLDAEVYEKAYLLICLAIAGFELGYLATRGSVPQAIEGRRDISFRSILIFASAAIAISIYLGPVSTPISSLVSYREEVASSFGDGLQRLVRVALLRTPIYVAVLAAIWKFRTSPQHRKPVGILLCVMLPVFLVVNFPTAVSRAWLGTILISVFVVVMLTSRSRSWNYMPLAICLTFVTAFPFMHRFRRAGFKSESGVVEDVFQSYVRGDFDVFSMTAHFVAYIDSAVGSVTWGHQLIGSLFFFVPRAWWPSKPVGSGYHVAESAGFPFLNVSAPFWSEGLINFGVPGVLLFMACLGGFMKRLDVRAAHGYGYSTIIFAFMSGFLVLVLRGDLMTTMTIFVPFALSVAAIRIIR